MAAYSAKKSEFDEIGVSILAASVDTRENAALLQDENEFPIAYGVTRAQTDTIGCWWEERRSIVQPSNFVLDDAGKVLSATYSTGPVGRLEPEDALKFIRFVDGQKKKAQGS